MIENSEGSGEVAQLRKSYAEAGCDPRLEDDVTFVGKDAWDTWSSYLYAEYWFLYRERCIKEENSLTEREKRILQWISKHEEELRTLRNTSYEKSIGRPYSRED